MTVKISHGSPAVVLAPMEGVTDAPMRAFLTDLGGFSFCVSEFIRVSQDVLPGKVFLNEIPELRNGGRTASGVSVQVQLLGGNPERLASTALAAYRVGATSIDLNFGCPAPTVNRHDGGATLLQYPDRIFSIVRAVREILPPEVPVSVKMRLGWNTLDAVYENAEKAAEAGAAWITIHGRTKFQGYTPPAYWGPIGEVRKRVSIPVVANGEIWTLDDFRRCRDETGCEHFMLGRGALADPSLARAVARELGLTCPEPRAFGVEPEAWLPLLEGFARHCEPFAYGPTFVPRRMKQWMGLVKIKRALPWFDHFKRVHTVEEAFSVLREWKRDSSCNGSAH